MEGAQNVLINTIHIDELVEGEGCVCGRWKRAGGFFCGTCFELLTMPMRWSLVRRSPYFAEAYRRAIEHVTKQTVRRVLIAHDGARQAWPYRTLNEVAEDYELAGTGRCRAPKCGQPILFIRRDASSGMFPINESDAQPHKVTCKDPQWIEQDRERRKAKRMDPGTLRKGKRGKTPCERGPRPSKPG